MICIENEVKDMAMLNDGLREKITFLTQVNLLLHVGKYHEVSSIRMGVVIICTLSKDENRCPKFQINSMTHF